jgi:hypothetical protein
MKRPIPILIIFLSFIVFACSTPTAKEESQHYKCPALPANFENSDLLGTWVAEYGAAKDTLTIRDDGKYQQYYHRFSDNFQYISEWNDWWLEYGDSDVLYLHLENMHRCDHSDTLCQIQGGGGGEHVYWDFCVDRKVRMPNEVVLMVTGVPEQNAPESYRVWLWHMSPNPESGTYHFTLKNGP